jgi:putative acetyltransferase
VSVTRRPEESPNGTSGDLLRIRPYVPGDLETVVSVFTESVRELTVSRYDLPQREAWAPRPADMKHWRFRLRKQQTLIAELDSRCVGFLSFRRNGYIDLLYVRPGFERGGVATRLYRSVERTFLAAGVASAYTEASLIAQPFFKRQGFQTTRFEEIRIAGTLLQRWVMYKILNPIAE